MVAAGCGITIMPENMHLGHGTLARPLIEPELQRDVSLVTVAGRPYEPSVQHLVRAIRAYQWDNMISTANGRPYRILPSGDPSRAESTAPANIQSMPGGVANRATEQPQVPTTNLEMTREDMP
jgi:hypothetical protein